MHIFYSLRDTPPAHSVLYEIICSIARSLHRAVVVRAGARERRKKKGEGRRKTEEGRKKDGGMNKEEEGRRKREAGGKKEVKQRKNEKERRRKME